MDFLDMSIYWARHYPYFCLKKKKFILNDFIFRDSFSLKICFKKKEKKNISLGLPHWEKEI